MGVIEHLQGKSVGHPIHPILIRFPYAMLPTSLFFDVLSVFSPNIIYSQVAYYTMLVGVIGAFVASPFGFIDYLYELPKGTKASRLGALHGLLNVGVTALFLANVLLRSGLIVATTPAPFILLSSVGVALLAVSGYQGGRLVYHYGFRVDAREPRLHVAEEQKRAA